MSEPAYGGLIITKLRRPQALPDMVARPRLLARLRQGQRGPLTLVVAPAGFGKTTSVISWLLEAQSAKRKAQSVGPLLEHSSAQTLPRFAWLSLDAEDNDLVRFWAYVCAACDQLAPGCAADAQALLRAPQPPPAPIVVAALINGLAALPADDCPERPYVLVLDDYHLIERPAIHEALALLVERLPPQVHLLITARADPPLPLARLRARRQLSELRAADLRFTSEEARALLELSGLSLDATGLAALEARTEGWVAGLHLATLALQGRPDPAAFIAAFAGSHRYVFDYLADEVLSRLPAEAHAFLLRTSVLGRLCGELCDAVLGHVERATGGAAPAYGRAMLAELERAGLFLIPLDGERRWYRYHQLFADVLLARLRETAPAEEAELHRRASRWYAAQAEQHDPTFLGDAVRHALAAGDADRAADLVDRAAARLWVGGDLTPLLELIHLLSIQSVAPRPRLAIALARALLIAGDLDAVPPLLAVAAQALDRIPDSAALRGWTEAIASHAARLHERPAEAIAHAEAALALLPADDRAGRGFVALGLAMTHHISGDLAAAVAQYEAAILPLAEANDRYAEVTARCLCGTAWLMRGDLDAATGMFTQALQRSQVGGGRLPIAAMALSGLSEIAYLRSDLDGAAQLCDESLALAEHGQVRDARFVGYELRVKIDLARNDLAGAAATAEALRVLAETHHIPQIIAWARSVTAWVDLASGQLAKALRWADGYRPVLGSLNPPIRADEFMVYLRVLLAAGRPAEAREWVERQLPYTKACGNHAQQLLLLVLKAQAQAAQGEPQAAATLAQARALAAPARITLPFQGAAPAPAAPERAAPALAEPLTSREREILAYVAAGRSNQEIAAALVVSVGTVKTHLHSLYGKLEARDRTHAVARARELGVIVP